MRAEPLSAAVVGLALAAPLCVGARYFETNLSFIDVGHLCARQLDGGFGGGGVSALIGNGAPVLAHPSFQTLYPLRWAVAWMPASLGAALFTILHLAIGAAATARLARSYSLPPWTAAFAGVAFAFAGPSLELFAKSEYKVAAAWLPLAWWAARDLLRSGRLRGYVGFAAAGTLLLLGGDPQAFGIALVLAGVEVAAALLATERPKARRPIALRRAGLLLLAAAGSLAFGWLQWGPTLVETSLSRRAEGLPLDEALSWGFLPSTWIGSLLPGVLRAELWPGVLWFEMWDDLVGPSPPWTTRPFWGPLWIAAAVAAAIAWRRRGPAVVAGGGLLSALGPVTPFLPVLMTLIPTLTKFRFPAKYLVVTTLALALLGAAGFHQAALRRDVRRGLLAGLLAMLVGMGALYASHGLWGPTLDEVAASTTNAGAGSAVELPLASAMLRAALFQSAAFLVVAALLLWRFGPKPVAALALLQLLLAAPDAVEVGPDLVDVPSPLRNVPATDEGLPPVVCVPDTVAAIVVEGPGGDSRWPSMLARRVWGLPEWPACDGVSTPVTYTDPLRSRTVEQLYQRMSLGDPHAARALGCAYVVEHDRPWPAWPSVDLAHPDSAPRVLRPAVKRVHDAAPFVSVVKTPRLVEEPEVVASVSASPGGPRAVVDDPGRRLDAEAELPMGDGVVVAGVERRTRDEVTVSLDGAGGAVVSLRSTFHLGWRATQGERELPVVRLGGALVGAVVDDAAAGPVTFRYRAPRRTSSWLLAMLGALGLVAGGVLARRAEARGTGGGLSRRRRGG